MKDNIVDQLGEALGILADYPHIDDVLNIGDARSFLSKLSESKIAFAPSFTEVNADEFIKESKNSIQEWVDNLNRLEGVFAVAESRSPKEIIWGAVDKYLNAKTNSDELYFCFERNNKAELNGKEGTWAEIYKLIVEHVNENLIIPEVLETSEE